MEKNLIIFISGLIFLLLPWYYTNSGLPQPVDAAILILFFIFFLLRFPGLNFFITSSEVMKLFLTLSFYITVSLLLNYIIATQENTLLLIVQNIYSVLLVIVFLCMTTYLYQRFNFNDYYRIILIFLLIGSIIPLLCWLKMSGKTGRLALSFNNENQLGFYALVNLSIFFYTTLMAYERNSKSFKLLSLIIMNLNLLFLFLSSSRACYPIILLYGLSYPLLFRFKFSGYPRLIIWFISSCLIFLITGFITYKLYLHMMSSRSAMNPTNLSGLFADFYFRAVRGIEGSFSNTWNLFFGFGTSRNSFRGLLEFHNNFLGILNIVGLFGLLIYIYMNVLIIKGLWQKGLYYLQPYCCYLFYSSMHYAHRTRINWMILVMFIFVIAYSQGHRKTLGRFKFTSRG